MFGAKYINRRRAIVAIGCEKLDNLQCTRVHAIYIIRPGCTQTLCDRTMDFEAVTADLAVDKHRLSIYFVKAQLQIYLAYLV